MQETGSILHSKIRHSVFLTTGMSLFLLLLALLLIFWLGRHALQMARVKAPTVRHTEKLQQGVQKSQEELLSWVSMGDESKRAQRQEVWNQDIFPHIEELIAIGGEWTEQERDVLLQVRDKLYELEALQWWVEDSARSAGNRPSRQLFEEEASLVFKSLSKDVAEVFASQVDSSEAGPKLIGALSDLRAELASAHASFGQYLLAPEGGEVLEYQNHLTEAQEAVATMANYLPLLEAEDRERGERVASNLAAYANTLDEARRLEESATSNQAEYVLEGEIAKAIEFVSSRLVEIDRRELAALESGGKSIENLTWLALIGLPLFMLATAFVAVKNARKLFSGVVVPLKDLVKVAEAVNQGNYEERVEVKSEDEVGLLAVSFNNMAESFQEITDVAIAVACGDFSKRLDVDNEKDWLRAAINAMNNKLVEVTSQARLIADGDYSTDFTPMSDRDELGHALKQMTVNLRESTAKLATSEARSTAVIRTAQDGIVTIGEDRTIHSFNEAAERMFGYRAGEIVGQKIARLITESDNRSTQGAAAGRSGGQELVARRKDGTTFPVLLSIGEAVVDDKRIFTGILRDLTAEKEARAELDRHLLEQEEQSWFKSQLSSVYDEAQGVTDPRLLCKTMLSKLAEQLTLGQALFYCLEEHEHSDPELVLYAAYGFSREDQEHVPLSVELENGLVGECAHQKRIIVLRDIPESYLRISSGLGGDQPKQIMLMPVMFERSLLGVLELATFAEFSEVQRDYLEQAVRTIGALLKGVMEQKRTQELLIVTQEQSENLRVQQEELRVSNEELRRQTDQLQASEEELRVGQIELAEANSQLRDNAKRLEVHNEILNTRNAELELAREGIRLKAEELENASKYKSEFLANMSHELRTPLNSILVLAKMLKENKQGTLDKKQQKFASVIHQSGNDLLALINEILDLSKIEAGMLEFEWEDHEVGDLVEKMDNLFNEVSKSKGLNFAINVDEDCPKELHTDMSRLEQVIKNLISNAFKFTADGGTVELRLSRQEDKTVLKHDCLIESSAIIAIAVRDTGIGIPANKHDAVFESFQQADGSTSRKYGGTGLGLSISRELVQRMGGEITLESEEGKGSTFTVHLPADFDPNSQAAKSAGPAAKKSLPKSQEDAGAGPSLVPAALADVGPGSAKESPPERPAPRKTMVNDDRHTITTADQAVLIIEHDLGLALNIQACARERGFKGVVTGDGEEALELAQQFAITAVVLDLDLPSADGWELLSNLKKDDKMASVPVFVVSSLEVKERALALGAQDALEKPVRSERLMASFDGLRLPKVEIESEGKVLIIEDDEKQCYAVQELLESRGFSTASAFDAEEAMAQLDQEQIELVILDLGLPDVPGIELLDRIREREQSRNLPIIVLTGQDVDKADVSRMESQQCSVVIKTEHSDQRLLDETALCLRQLEDEGVVHKPERARAANSRTVLKNKIALVVDDDDRNISALSSLLEEHLMKVVVAYNGREALEKLDEHPNVDIVLMDVMMPEMDGYEAIRNIRRHPDRKNLPVIAVTAKTMKGDREASLEAGASEYISKPIDTEKLLTLLSVWLYR